MSLIPNTLVAQWFVRRRGFVFSLMTFGSFASAMSFPLISTWLIQTWDWRFAWSFWGVLLLVIFVPIALFGVRNNPEEMGLRPEGNQKQLEKFKPVLGTTIVEAEQDWTLKEAMKTKSFWAILICVGIPAMVNTGITFHIISIFGSNNIKPEIAALVLSLMAVVGIPSL